MRLDEILQDSISDKILYHGGQSVIRYFRVPPYGVFFSPHVEWAENYGPAVTQAKVHARSIYLVDYTHDIDEDIIDALFDRDYSALEKLINVLISKGFDALQTVTDSEMIVAFPGTHIEVVGGTKL
jgi:hypothetical protein